MNSIEYSDQEIVLHRLMRTVDRLGFSVKWNGEGGYFWNVYMYIVEYGSLKGSL